MSAHRILPVLSVLALAGCMVPLSTPTREHGASVPVARQTKPEAPLLKKQANGRYRVRKPWTVVLNGRSWTVPRGYSSNGITAPSKIKASLGDGVDHPETWAAVFHDWLFTQPGITRSTADRTFYELLRAYDVPDEKARLMFTSVSAYSLSKAFR